MAKSSGLAPNYTAGRDRRAIYDGARDVVSCGPGNDTVYYEEGVDRITPSTCENRFPG